MHRTKTALYAYSATEPIKDYLHSKQPGVTVFWAPAYSGKSFTLSHLAYPISASDHIFVRIDYRTFHADGSSVVHFLHGKLGLKDHRCALSAFLPRDAAFITVVLDHFEVAMQCSLTDATNLIRELSDDSRTAQFYNVLVLTNKDNYAQTLLRSSLGRLLGPQFCGRWVDWPGGELLVCGCLNAATDKRENIVACGTLMPVCCSSLSAPRMQLEIARLNREWDDGERLLACYRDDFMV